MVSSSRLSPQNFGLSSFRLSDENQDVRFSSLGAMRPSNSFERSVMVSDAVLKRGIRSSRGAEAPDLVLLAREIVVLVSIASRMCRLGTADPD